MNKPVASTPASEDRNSTLVSFRFATANFPALRSLLIILEPLVRISIAQLGQTRHSSCNQAIDILFREASTEATLIRQPVRGGTGVHSLDKAIEQCVQTLNVLTLGIDPIKYRFFVRNTPTISWTASGLHQTNLSRNYNNVSDNVFWECYRFVVDVSLKLGEVFRASSVEP